MANLVKMPRRLPMCRPHFYSQQDGTSTRPSHWQSQWHSVQYHTPVPHCPQLTVAESWANQPNDVAVGYCVAISRKQWLLYRSLMPPRSRTLLGHNLSTETLVARFDRRGQVEPLIEIE